METKTVRISMEAFEAIKKASDNERRSFINQLDYMILDNKPVTTKQKISRFVKPEKAEVWMYIEENSYNVDVEKWFSHYEANGWKIGKNPMKDWRAAVRTWHSPEAPKPKANEGWQHNPTAEVHQEARNMDMPSEEERKQIQEGYERLKKEGKNRPKLTEDQKKAGRVGLLRDIILGNKNNGR